MGYFQYIILLNTRLLGRFAPIFNFVLFYRFFLQFLTFIGPDVFSRFGVYRLQTNKQTNKQTPKQSVISGYKMTKKKKNFKRLSEEHYQKG